MAAEMAVFSVTTARELKQAMREGRRHIEIREHLDLRPLELEENRAVGAIPGSRRGETHTAILAASSRLTSLRGNCASPFPATRVDGGELPALREETPDSMLPLKPFQCLLMIDKPWLSFHYGSVWIDNVYLKLQRQTIYPDMSVVTVGFRFSIVAETRRASAPSTLYVTNVTFQSDGDGRTPARSAIAIFTKSIATDMYVDDCIFTDWGGSLSPVNVNGESVASVRNTLFRSMHLRAEIADVSFGGAVHFQNVSLAGVTLEHGAVVSTSNNDDVNSEACYLYYEVEDDAGYDVPVEPVPLEQRGAFGEEFVVRNGTMSDCLFLPLARGVVLPGCAEESAAKRRQMREGLTGHLQVDMGRGQGDVCVPDAAPADGLRAPIAPDDPELAALRQALPTRPPPPRDWPPFVIPPPRETYPNRSSLLPPPRPVPLEVSERILPPFCAEAACIRPPPRTSPTAGAPASASRTSEAVAAVSMVLAFVLTVSVVAVLVKCGLRRSGRRRLEDASRSCDNASTQATSDGGGRRASRRSPQDTSHLKPPRAAEAPGSSLNPAYEYALPPHLALLAAPTPETFHTGSTPSQSDSAMLKSSDKAPTNSMGGSGPSRQSSARPQGSCHAACGRQAHAPPPLQPSPCCSGADEERRIASRLPPHATEPAPQSMQLAQASRSAHMGVTDVYSSNSAHACAGDAEVEPGNTVVCAPYTVSTCTVSCMHWDMDFMAPLPTPGLQPSVGCEHDQQPTCAPNRMRAGGRPRCSPGDRPLAATDSQNSDGEAMACRGQVPTSTDALTLPEVPGKRQSSCSYGSMHVQDSRGTRRLQQLHRQLDMFADGELFLGRFVMLGRQHRRHGGQALVQFADGHSDGCEYAVKFFFSAADFHAEADLYSACQPFLFHSTATAAHVAGSPATHETCAAGGAGGAAAGTEGVVDRRRLGDAAARFLPQVEAVCERPRDVRGRLLPPCIVMEKGESLHDWSDRADPDLFTAVAVLSHVSKCLADMHDAGFVHRDLKPANVMWLPRENRWTVIDFGCVARVGAAAPLSFTLAYAAPEVVAAFAANQRLIEATAALDAWSLGVMAFELLTGAPAFQLLTYGCERVVAMLKGELPLPWEGGLSTQHAQRLGAFKAVVLQLLHRAPGQRLGLRAFHAACTDVFASHSAIHA